MKRARAPRPIFIEDEPDADEGLLGHAHQMPVLWRKAIGGIYLSWRCAAEPPANQRSVRHGCVVRLCLSARKSQGHVARVLAPFGRVPVMARRRTKHRDS